MGVQEVLDTGRPVRGSVAVGSGRHQFGLYVFLISFACVYYASNAPVLVGNTDLGWHLAAGDLIRARGSIPFHDPWSFTSLGREWFNLSWLWDVLASIVFQYSGYTGLTLSVIACGAVIAGYLTFICLRSGASAAAVCISVLSVCLLYPSFATAPNSYLAASPNTATMLFCVVLYGECLRRTRWFLLPALMALWVNLHGGFLLGFLIIGVFGAAALLRRDMAGVKAYGIAGVGCFLAIFINPLGWHIYDGVTATLGHFVQDYITEWLPYSRNIAMPGSIPALVYILIFVALEVRYRVSCLIEPRLLAWLFLGLGLYQFRYMSFFFIFSAIPLALHLHRLLPKALDDIDVQRSLLTASFVGVCALPMTILYMQPALGLAEMVTEQDARYIQAHFPHARLLNHWNVGGLFIFFTRGAIPVFVDGRAATAYPDALLHDYFRLSTREINESAWDSVLAKYRIDTVLWVRAHEQLRRFLVGRRGWTEAYDGQYESVYVKPNRAQPSQ